MSRYTYVHTEYEPPFKKRIRYTRGEFVCISEPMGVFGFQYAIFRNRRSEVLIPLHDLTDETRAAIGAPRG